MVELIFSTSQNSKTNLQQVRYSKVDIGLNNFFKYLKKPKIQSQSCMISKFIPINYMKELFQNTEINNVISFLKTVKLYTKI